MIHPLAKPIRFPHALGVFAGQTNDELRLPEGRAAAAIPGFHAEYRFFFFFVDIVIIVIVFVRFRRRGQKASYPSAFGASCFSQTQVTRSMRSSIRVRCTSTAS
jgi:hypothetical protein